MKIGRCWLFSCHHDPFNSWIVSLCMSCCHNRYPKMSGRLGRWFCRKCPQWPGTSLPSWGLGRPLGWHIPQRLGNPIFHHTQQPGRRCWKTFSDLWFQELPPTSDLLVRDFCHTCTEGRRLRGIGRGHHGHDCHLRSHPPSLYGLSQFIVQVYDPRSCPKICICRRLSCQ